MSYRHHLLTECDTGQTVWIDRDGAPSIHGPLLEVGDEGCVVKLANLDETAFHTFVAFKDIRGVATKHHDYDQIGK